MVASHEQSQASTVGVWVFATDKNAKERAPAHNKGSDHSSH